MNYTTILVHVDDAPGADERFGAAAQLARSAQAHLVGLASSGVAAFSRDVVATDFSSPAIIPYLETLRQRAAHALERFAAVAGACAVQSVERRQTDDDAFDVIGVLAAYADLTVLDHYGGAARPDGRPRQVAAEVTARSGCPVLLVPQGVRPSMPPRRIVLAWNASREAARALRAAMPLLQGAEVVDVAMFGEVPDARQDICATAEIRALLRRYGVDANIVRKSGESDVGHALMELAVSSRADLLVMGCYGHSRVRELLLGGATRSVLMSADVPVFMSA
ncbi:universal stress protein [Massilia violaceinigra]|uniref:Universal stress protein n=1 Tax=Massilia violaceinigra TaxID=2045208 RepID=A0ABY4A2L0_9BURK|nr:universal stress protein [Massilia violaceinigra]UOD29000.1 universal stress protein [Massilia violaceinigra]